MKRIFSLRATSILLLTNFFGPGLAIGTHPPSYLQDVSVLPAFYHAQNTPDTAEDHPDAEYTHSLSPLGPLSREVLMRPDSLRLRVRTKAQFKTGVSTYTYLRCYYSIGDARQPTTDYLWAMDPDSPASYYTVHGYWAADGRFAWSNMFFTDVPRDRLRLACNSTLRNSGIKQTVGMYFAADNRLSFNYDIWINDPVDAPKKINRIVAFGDSLTDGQNMYNASNWNLPNHKSWYAGHFSNGYTWAEYLAQDIGVPIHNWAIGGAGTDWENMLIPGLVQQVVSWVSYLPSAKHYKSNETLFVMLIGANDLANYHRSVSYVIENQRRALDNLISHGAGNILLLNLPDISRAPAYTQGSRGDASALAAQVLDYNRRLAELTGSLRGKYGDALHIEIFDTYSTFNRIILYPENYGIDDTVHSCLDINGDASTSYITAHSPRKYCADSSRFVFWDTLHPTTRIHELLAAEVLSFVRQEWP
jgi:thermolabile hemolysin